MPTRPRQHGFTIIELLVTMVILGLMLFLVNQLFNDTSRAVTTSVQVSKTIATSRSINEQLTIDADAMLGPGVSADGGFIVITQRRLTNPTMVNPQTLGEVTVSELRVDQIAFVRDAEGLKSMTPSAADTYGTSIIGLPGDRARVWYGHAVRTLPNGQVNTDTGSGLGGAKAGRDRIGSDFIMGRQALLFNPTDQSTGNLVSASAVTQASGYGAIATVSNSGYGAGALLYKGLTDVVSQEYGPAGTAGTALFALTDPSVASDRLDSYLNMIPAFRLYVNPAPDPDVTNYASWAIAQGHPILAQSCSEIIIDFAADLNGDGLIDTAFGGQSSAAGAPTFWYDGLKQNLLTDGTTAGTTGWVTQAGVPQPWINQGADIKTFVFRVDDDLSFADAGGTLGVAGSAHSYWPYMIRIRYRLHDTRGRLTSNYPAALRDGLDNNGDGSTDENGEDRISGRWFERILSVPRPE